VCCHIAILAKHSLGVALSEGAPGISVLGKGVLGKGVLAKGVFGGGFFACLNRRPIPHSPPAEPVD